MDALMDAAGYAWVPSFLLSFLLLAPFSYLLYRRAWKRHSWPDLLPLAFTIGFILKGIVELSLDIRSEVSLAGALGYGGVYVSMIFLGVFAGAFIASRKLA